MPYRGLAGPLFMACSLCCHSGNATRPAPPVPLYPYWTLAQLPDGPVADRQPPHPAGSAALIAANYLLTSTEGMGAVADDFGLDPTVFVYDGAAWHRGRYVDRDHGSGLALIRADGVPGTPVRIRKNEDTFTDRLIGIPAMPGRPMHVAPTETLAAPCGPRVRLQPLDGEFVPPEREAICLQGRVRDLPGGLFMDISDIVSGMQVEQTGDRPGGPDAAAIRDFVDTYFSSWGRDVRPRPEI